MQKMSLLVRRDGACPYTLMKNIPLRGRRMQKLSLLVALALLIGSAHAATTGLWEPAGGYTLNP